MANPRIYKYEIPVDGTDHEFVLAGEVVHVACTQHRDSLEFWVLLDGAGHPISRYFQVFATGQEIGPGKYRHTGTAIVPVSLSIGGVRLVWHLMERV
jgi:hypothetical protein